MRIKESIIERFTSNVEDKGRAIQLLINLNCEMGGHVDSYPAWIPVLSCGVFFEYPGAYSALMHLMDHPIFFKGGFTCSYYSEYQAARMKEFIEQYPFLSFEVSDVKLYTDTCTTVIVRFKGLEFNGKGHVKLSSVTDLVGDRLKRDLCEASITETWDSVKEYMLGSPSYFNRRDSLAIDGWHFMVTRKLFEGIDVI